MNHNFITVLNLQSEIACNDMNIRYYSFFILSICLVTLRTLAQPDAISLVHYTTDEGLSHDEVRSILKDREGFMWFGTSGGLNRFDGHTFKVYLHDPKNLNSLPDNSVVGITEAADGVLWLATNSGLCRFDPQKQTFELIEMPEHLDQILSNEGVSRMVIDKEGYGWFGCYGYLVKINLQTREMQRFTNPDNVLSPGDIFLDSIGRMWVGIQTALYRFHPQEATFQYHFGNVKGVRPGVDIGKVYEDEKGNIWCGSWGLGLFRYNESLDKFEDFPDGNTITVEILGDRDAEGKRFFWVAGGLDGLNVYYPHEHQTYRMTPDPREPYSHNGFLVKKFYKDPATGIVWMATEFGGVEKYDPKSSRFRRALIPIEKEFTQFSFVSSVLNNRLDPSGQQYWVAVWGTGLFEWNRRENSFRFVPPRADGAFNNEVFDIAQDAKGTLYLATAGGVTVYQPLTGKSEFVTGFMNYPFVFNKALSVMVDHAGMVWIGANYDGLFRYDPKTHQVKKVPFFKPGEVGKTTGYITKIQEDEQHRLWIATHAGVFIFEPGTGKSRYLHGEALPDRYRSDGLFLGRNGRVWVATIEGLIQMDTSGRVIRKFGYEDGLKSEHIFNVIEDGNGMVWLATTNLLYRLDPESKALEWFDKRDGLFGNSLTDGFCMTDNGEIFIGFQNAFNYFNPTQTTHNQVPPKIVFTGFTVLNKERIFNPEETLVLRPGENVFSISFAALNFSQPEKNRYAYKLEGFDPDWVFTDQPMGTYTNLDGGNYTFRVRASNNDGVWNELGASVSVKVIPPFRETWYFTALLILLAGGLVSAILIYRQQQRHRLDAIRERIARDLHDDMGSTLSSIRFFSEFARSKVANPEVSPILQRISESAASLSESMQDIIWAINTKNEQLDDLITRMRQFGFKMLEARGIELKVQVSDSFRSARLSIGQRRNIYLIFKEAVNNAAKYSNCTQVKLYIALIKSDLRMEIEDNGTGFDEQDIERGHGLTNMRKRAAEIGGDLRIESSTGQGARIQLNVKL